MNIQYDEEYGSLSINGKDIPSDDGESFYVEKSEIENIRLEQVPLQVSLAVCRKVYKEQYIDTSEYIISKINNDSAKVSFDDGLMNEDYDEIIQEYEVTLETWMKTKIDVISKFSEKDSNISLDESIIEDNIYISYSIIIEGDTLGIITKKADELSKSIDNEVDSALNLVSKDIDELIEKIDIIQRFFEDNYGFSLFRSYNLKSIMNLKKDVNSFDDLTIRLKDLVAQLIENINKEELDKAINCSSKGSRISLENFLKAKYKEDTKMIEDEIIINSWALYNLRTEYVHERNRNYKKALKILKLKETDLPQYIWKICIRSALNSFSKMLTLIMQGKFEKDSEYFIELAKEKLKTEAKIKVGVLLAENKSSEAALHILINVKRLLDIELAKMLGQNVVELRKNLYPLLSNIILYSYHKDGTLVWIIDEMIPLVKEVICSNEN